MLTDLRMVQDSARFGGKAAGLCEALRLGLPVPPSVVLAPPERSQEHLERWIGEAAEAATAWAIDGGIDHLAIRSSAAVEDQAQHSYAGIFRSTFTHVERQAVADAISEVLDSVGSPERHAYEQAAGITAGSVRIAVLVQATVAPHTSGIMFAWGEAGDRRFRIQGTWGLSLNLVQGITAGDVALRRPAIQIAEATAGGKSLAVYPYTQRNPPRPGDFAIVRFETDEGSQDAAGKVVYTDEDAGLAYFRVPDDFHEALSLRDRLVEKLSEIASVTPRGYPNGVDIEWVEDIHGKVWVVQMRPVTSVPPDITGTDAIAANSSVPTTSSMRTVGEPGSPGVFSGITADPTEMLGFNLEDGRVLVCGAARPELMTAVARAGAIVSSDGGILCHIAIVARELGKPCVIGIPDAESSFRNGELITVDGTAGVVTRDSDGVPSPEPSVPMEETTFVGVEDLGEILEGHAPSDPVLVVGPEVQRHIAASGGFDPLLQRVPTLIVIYPRELDPPSPPVAILRAGNWCLAGGSAVDPGQLHKLATQYNLIGA